jgi:hypothetical protein
MQSINENEFECSASTVTIEENGNVVRQFTGPSKLSLDEGTYTVIGRPPTGASTSTTVTLVSGETRSVNLRATGAGMERWEHAEEWKLQNGWYSHHGGGFVLYDSPSGPGDYVFAMRLPHSRNPFSHGGRTQWVVAYLDPKNYIEMQVDNKFFYRTEIVNGTRHELPKIEHHIPDSAQFATFSIEVSAGTLTQRYSVPNGDWKILDTWVPGKTPSLVEGKMRNFTDGKFGFLIPEDRTLEISNFAYYSKGK